MADPTLSTRLSRRSMLAAPLTANVVLPVAALSELDGPKVDAALFRRIFAAWEHLAAYRRAEAADIRPQHAVDKRPSPTEAKSPSIGEPVQGDTAPEIAAEARCEALYESYEAALVVVFTHPARTLAGVHGKLCLAAEAIKQDQNGLLDPADCSYLDATLTELERFVHR